MSKLVAALFLALFALCVAAGSAASAGERFLGETSHVVLAQTGCNATSLWQIPGSTNLFLGRQMILAPGAGACSGRDWMLVLDRLDWKTHAVTLIRPILTPPVAIDGGKMTITSAYDPAVVRFGGALWVAFECAGPGIPGASTCIAPFGLKDGAIDPARCYVIVEGNRPVGGTQYSASDPKFLLHQGRLYLYWTAIRFDGDKWVSLATRGEELKAVGGAAGRLWAAGASGPTQSNDPKYNVEVWAGADMFSLIDRGGWIYATAGAAQRGCVRPSDDRPGCFRTVIDRARSPLGPDVFGRHLAPAALLPANPAEYARFAEDDGHRLTIIEHITPKHPSDPMGNDLPAGLVAYPVDLARLFPR